MPQLPAQSNRDILTQLMGKSREEVVKLFGVPKNKSSVKHSELNPETTDKKAMKQWLEQQEQTTYTELEYDQFIVHLNIAGQVISVTSLK